MIHKNSNIAMFFHGLWVHYVHLLNTAGGPELVFPPITAGFPTTKTPDSLLQISESLRLVLTTERGAPPVPRSASTAEPDSHVQWLM